MRLPIYQVDAFAGRVFTGNPAAVCLLDHWPADRLLQAIAAENNLSETAFVVEEGERTELRWFTPTTEVALCGHATLAAGFVLLDLLGQRDAAGHPVVRFHTRSGVLGVSRVDDRFWLDFPLVPLQGPVEDAEVQAALGLAPVALYAVRQVHGARYLLAEYAEPGAVAGLAPDIGRLRILQTNLIATAPGGEGWQADFVSRFFAPASGVDEDPVTGSAHCTLAPFWAERLGRNPLQARQISRRGGEVSCQVEGDRVKLGGAAALYLRGEITVPGA